MSITGTVTGVGNSAENPIQPNGDFSVWYIPQALTPSQQLQARANVGAIGPSEIEGLLNSVYLDEDSNTFVFGFVNKEPISISLVLKDVVLDVSFNEENNIVVKKEKENFILPLKELFSGFARTINGIDADDNGRISLSISDIPDLREWTENVVTSGRSITINGETKLFSEDLVWNIEPDLSNVAKIDLSNLSSTIRPTEQQIILQKINAQPFINEEVPNYVEEIERIIEF